MESTREREFRLAREFLRDYHRANLKAPGTDHWVGAALIGGAVLSIGSWVLMVYMVVKLLSWLIYIV